MPSIYDTVPVWVAGTSYSKYDIVKGSDNNFYYSLIDSNQANNPTSTANLQLRWDGYRLLNNKLQPNFFWQASYNSSLKYDPRVKRLRFGNGYEQRISDALNFNLIKIDLQFALRTEKETVSILHFLNEMGGKRSFVYNTPTILSKTLHTTRFICPEWDINYSSFNNYSIKCSFEEVSA